MDLKVLRRDELIDVVCVVVGTRPGIVKQSPVIRALQATTTPYFILHTGQHYSYEMDRQFFEELDLPEPDCRIDAAGYRLHGEQTAEMLRGVEAVLLEKRPRIVLVGGDANTNLAAALAARKLHIAVGHVEAGLRSFDWRMPEEHNRIMIDHISECLFAPTENARHNLVKESVRGEIHVVGNTVVDAVQENFSISARKTFVQEEFGLGAKQYAVVTVHREENTDYEENLRNVLNVIDHVIRRFDIDVVFPAHPRTQKRLAQFRLHERAAEMTRLRLVRPLGYLEFLALIGSANLVLTDSGGVQQEACILRVPCITLRDSTEWIETVEVGANIVTGLDAAAVVSAAESLLARQADWNQPFGDGTSGRQIVAVARHFLDLDRVEGGKPSDLPTATGA